MYACTYWHIVGWHVWYTIRTKNKWKCPDKLVRKLRSLLMATVRFALVGVGQQLATVLWHAIVQLVCCMYRWPFRCRRCNGPWKYDSLWSVALVHHSKCKLYKLLIDNLWQIKRFRADRMSIHKKVKLWDLKLLCVPLKSSSKIIHFVANATVLMI